MEKVAAYEEMIWDDILEKEAMSEEHKVAVDGGAAEGALLGAAIGTISGYAKRSKLGKQIAGAKAEYETAKTPEEKERLRRKISSLSSTLDNHKMISSIGKGTAIGAGVGAGAGQALYQTVKRHEMKAAQNAQTPRAPYHFRREPYYDFRKHN